MILRWPGARNSVMVPGGEIKAGSNAFSSTQLTRLSRPRLFQRFAARVARGGFGLREHSLYTRIEAKEMVSNPKRMLERKRGVRHCSPGWHRPSVLAAAIKFKGKDVRSFTPYSFDVEIFLTDENKWD